MCALSSSSYSHPTPPAAPLFLIADFLSRPVSAPAGPGRHSPAPGKKATHTSMPTLPKNTYIYTKLPGAAEKDKIETERISKSNDEDTDDAMALTFYLLDGRKMVREQQKKDK